VLRRSTMFHAAPDGAGYIKKFASYKHVAPPEQAALRANR
jgi:hypothetical protein